MAPLAHAAHTLTTIAYFVPVVAFLIWLSYTVVKDRLVKKSEDGGGGGERPPA
jgi:hypothetical protein